MSSVSFENGIGISLNFPSIWKSNVRKSTVETQTPDNFYEFNDAQTQSGLRTDIIGELGILIISKPKC